MKIGLWGTTASPPAGMSPHLSYRAQIDEIVLAEECGFDHYWFFEHHVSPHSPMPSPNLMIAAAALMTSRIRLGTLMNILPYHHPLRIAEEMAMLDVLTNGRVDFGVGRGVKPYEFRAFGQDQNIAREVFQESLQLILKIWSDEPFSFEGRYFKVEKKTPLSPPLVQRPHPPIYTSAQSPESLRWAAEHDLPFGQIDATIEESAADQAAYRELQIANGHAPTPRLFLTRETYVVANEDEARQMRDLIRPYVLNNWQVFGRYTQFADSGELPGSYDAFRKRAPKLYALNYDEIIENGLAFIGTPETIARQIHEHRAQLDIAMFVFHMRFGGMPYDMAARSIRLFGSEVIPRLRDQAKTADAQAAPAA